MAHKEELIAGLQKLMKSDGIKRSKMGLVFEIYDTLVELRNSGVKVADIENLLNDPAGVFKFELPKGSLTSYMHRIKLKKAASRVERRVAVAAVEPAALPKPRKPRTPAAPDLLDGGKPGKAEPETPIENKQTGFVDIFALQAEREAKKDSEKKIQKIPRR